MLTQRCTLHKACTELTGRLAGMKYSFGVSRRGPQSYRLSLGKNFVDVVARKLNDGGLLVQVCLSLY